MISSDAALKKTILSVDKNHWLLVFPLPLKKEPLSVWHILHPRSVMRWEWDETGDGRVVQLWHLRRRLAESHRVVYSKWFRGRATLLSLETFQKLWVYFASERERLSGEAREILDLLEMESPLSTKDIRRGTDLGGKINEKRYVAAMKELWRTMAIVGVGEIDDGAFPSLAHAASHVIFEDICRQAENNDDAASAKHWLQTNIPSPLFQRQLKV